MPVTQSADAASRTPTIRPILGMWTFDPPQYVPDGASPDMLNMQVCSGYLRKRPGVGKYTSGTFPALPLTGIASVQDNQNVTRLFVTTRTTLYRYNASTHNYDAMTGPAFTGSNFDLFSFEVSQNNLVLSQGVDNIMALPLGGTVYAALSASSFPSKYLCRFNDRLYAAVTQETGTPFPFRLRWPVDSDHTDWTGVGSGFNDLADEPTSIRGIKKLMGAMAVYCEKGIYLATKTGGAIAPAQFDLVVHDIGLFSPKSIAGYNVQHFFVGTDNFYTFNSIQVSPLLSGVRTSLFLQLDPSQQNTNFGLLNYENQEYLAFVFTVSRTSPDMVWVYNWSRSCAYPWRLGIAPTCGTIHRLDITAPEIIQLIGTIADQNYEINTSILSSTYPGVLIGTQTGTVYLMSTLYTSDDGAAITCRWTSKDYTGADVDPNMGNHMITVKSIGISYFDLTATPFTLQFSYSSDRGVTWTGPFPITLGGTGSGEQRDAMLTEQFTAARVRFKFENVSASESPNVVELKPTIELRQQLVA